MRRRSSAVSPWMGTVSLNSVRQVRSRTGKVFPAWEFPRCGRAGGTGLMGMGILVCPLCDSRPSAPARTPKGRSGGSLCADCPPRRVPGVDGFLEV